MTSSNSRSSFWGSSKKEEKKDKKKEKKSKKDKPMVGKVIGAPTNFQRHMHIGFNKDSGEFEVTKRLLVMDAVAFVLKRIFSSSGFTRRMEVHACRIWHFYARSRRKQRSPYGRSEVPRISSTKRRRATSSPTTTAESATAASRSSHWTTCCSSSTTFRPCS